MSTRQVYYCISLSQLKTLDCCIIFFRLVKTADKLLKEAEHNEMLQDEEKAYVLFMKYFNVVTTIKKSADYKRDKV